MPAANIGLLNGSPTAGGTDGVLVDAGNPIAGPDFFTGADTIGTPVKLAARVLVPGYKRTGTFTIELLGASADRWSLAPDAGGAPGIWGAWGASLALPGPITPTNTLFWARSRALAGDAAGDDTIVVLRTPDDVAAGAPVGRSWVLPYVVGNVASVGRSWALPYNVLATVGKSWALPSTVLASVGKSWALPYAILASGFTDNFNRADSSSVGNNWTDYEPSGAVAIASNRLSFSGIGASGMAAIRRTADVPPTSGGIDISARVFRPSGGTVVHWIGRFDTTDPEVAMAGVFAYIEVTTAGVPLLTLFKCGVGSGVVTNMRSGGGTTTGSTIDATNGSVFRLVSSGSSHVLYQDGVAVANLTITDAGVIATGCIYATIRARGAVPSSGITATLDDVQILAA